MLLTFFFSLALEMTWCEKVLFVDKFSYGLFKGRGDAFVPRLGFFLLKVVLEKKDGMWFGVRFYGAYGRKGMVVFSIIQLFEEKQVIGDI